MPKVVEVPGVGNVEFPDSMSDADIAAAIRTQSGPKPPSEQEPTLAGFGQNVLTSGKNLVGGLYHAVTNPRETATGLYNLGAGLTQKLMPGDWPQEKYAEAFGNVLKERYGSPEALGRTMYTDPIGTLGDLSTLAGTGGLLFKGVKLGSELAGASRLATTAGTAATGLEGVAASTDPIRLAMRTAMLPLRPLKLPEKLYGSALKPGPGTYTLPEVKSMVQTGIQEGVPVSEGGVKKLWDLVGDLDAKTTAAIEKATGRGVTIAPEKVASRVEEIRPRFSNQVNPEKAGKLLDRSKQEFLRQHQTVAPFTKIRESLEVPGFVDAGKGETILPKPIPASQAQLIKQGTYRALKDTAYGELKNAQIESQKALARGVREELAAAIPEIAALTERESKALGLMDALEHAVRRQSNHQIFGIGTPIAASGVAAVTGSPQLALIAGTLRAVIDNPNIKSRLAIAVNRAQKANPQRFGPARMATAMSRIESYLQSLKDSQSSQPLAPATSTP